MESAQKSSGGNTDPPSRKRSRNWTFTIWNKEEPKYNEDKMNYLGFGAEVCPDTKKSHWQGFVCFKNELSLAGLSKEFGKTNHYEIIRGSLKDNIKYCSKEGQYKEFGKLPEQGKRTDLNEIKDEIMKGKKVDDICLENANIYHQYGRTLNKIEDIYNSRIFRTEMTKGIWYWGKTGVGKSHKAFENFNTTTHYNLPKDKEWWDGYKGQKTVIINDFRGELPFSYLLQLIDKWPFNVSRRGREPMPFTSETVIITSSKNPEDLYGNVGEDFKQLLRRIEVIEIK